jgi:hypothetical protein
MINSQPLAIVIRIPNVTATRLELEAALQCQVAKYERSGASSYADDTFEHLSMRTLHHLSDSRSRRIYGCWKNSGVPYEMQHYQRNPQTRC